VTEKRSVDSGIENVRGKREMTFNLHERVVDVDSHEERAGIPALMNDRGEGGHEGREGLYVERGEKVDIKRLCVYDRSERRRPS
jgi:hypothetical protein